MKAKQFGRSIIEMLGVLAIIGVLVIGGVWGYRKAITKHLANSIIDDVNLSGFLVTSELFNKLPNDDVGMDMTDKFDQKSPYKFKAFAETDSSFEILVQGVPYSVCQEIIDRELKDFDEVRANGFAKECTSEQDNEVSFFFDLNQSDRCSQDSDCGHCSHCVKNRCQYGFTDRSGNNCFDCNNVRESIYDVKEEECHRCKNRMYSDKSTDTFSGRCLVPLTHDINYWSHISKEDCEKFPNQYAIAGFCFYCEGTWDTSTGVCSTTDCHRGRQAYDLYGLSENDCVRCGGEFSMVDSKGKKIGRCRKDTYWD